MNNQLLEPCLTRPGRIKPIYLNCDWKTLQEFSKHYFKKQLTCKPFPIKSSLSEIVEFMVESKEKENPFEYFQTILKYNSIFDNDILPRYVSPMVTLSMYGWMTGVLLVFFGLLFY